MANPTTNFGWVMPTSTDLVTDLPADFAVFGQAVDTSMMDLKGGTTGQVLSKASNTDMDFTWVAQDDSNAIQNAIVDAKGDLIGATAADTPARLAVGTNGQVLTADSTAATGLAWATPSSGSMTVLASGSLSGTSLSLTSISASYQDLLLVCNNFYPSANSYLQVKVNNTANIYARTSTTSSTNPISTAQIDFSNTEVYNGDKDNYLAFRIENYANTTSNKFAFENWILGNIDGTNWNIGQAIDAIRTTSAISRIDLILTAGSFSAGTYTLYGVK